MKFHLLLTFRIAMGVLLLMPASPCHSQQHSHDSESRQPAIKITPKTKEFTEAADRFRDVLKRLVDAEIRFHNSDDRKQETLYRRDWNGLREEAFLAHQTMLHAGVAEYLSDPPSNPDLANFLFATLKRNVEGDSLEGMLPIAKALYETGYPAPELIGMYSMCCLAENEFDKARELLAPLVSGEEAPEELIAIHQRLDDLALAWKEEQAFRERDAAGEPLPQARVTTTKGEFVIELFENDAPQAVANFISLAERSFYDYSQFFLVIENVMAQAGCPKADGTGGPGYFLPRESDEHAKRKIFRGSVALALLPGMPDSGGSQFMITYLPVTELEEHSTVFGRVISGMPNVARLNRAEPAGEKKEDEANKPPEPRDDPDEIIAIEIIGKRNHPYEPTRLSSPASKAPSP